MNSNVHGNKRKFDEDRSQTRIVTGSYLPKRLFRPCNRMNFISSSCHLYLSGMFVRLLKLLWQLALVQCISGRMSLPPKFYGQDSAIIIDTDKTRLNPKLQNALYYNLPVYKLVNQVPNTPKKTAMSTVDEYPIDLVHIARTKLGFKSRDQLPSLNELGNLLGTSSAEETIKYVRTLTSTDQGIALMKAYLESMEYEQNESDADTENAPVDEDDHDGYDDNDDVSNNADLDANYENKSPKLNKPVTTKSPALQLETGGLMDSINEFMKQYGLWPESSTTATPLPYKRVLVAPMRPTQSRPLPAMRPVLIRQPLPYHYPIPLRPVILPPPGENSFKSASVANITDSASAQDVKPPHLNTPKEPSSQTQVPPHVHQLAQMANISPQVLDSFLQQQPKLAELAKRISRLPLVQQHSRAIDSQLFMAVKKALSQDKNFQRLLGEAHTLE